MGLRMENLMFDWHLYEQQGLPTYLHRHDQAKWVQQCELQFLKKMMEEKNFSPLNLEENEQPPRSQSAHKHHRHHHHHHHHHHNNQSQHLQQQPQPQAVSLSDQTVLQGNHVSRQLESRRNSLARTGQNRSVSPIASRVPLPNGCCEFCGRPHCDQPDHPACKQQQLLCEQQRKQQQQRSRSAATHRCNRSQSCERSQTVLRNHDSTPVQNTLPTRVQEEQQLRAQVNTPPQFVLNTGGGGSFECVGGVRKAGFLSVKKWLLRRRQHVELVRKRGWKCYWACLKGTTLIFYQIGYSRDAITRPNSEMGANCCATCMRNRNCPFALRNENAETIYENLPRSQNWCNCDCHQQTLFNMMRDTEPNNRRLDAVATLDTSTRIHSQPKHLILVDGCIVQPIPEHPKREHVFCLSSAVGDAYLFQCPCENELFNWVDAIQSACGASIARERGLKGAIFQLTDQIESMQRKLERAVRNKLQLEQRLSSLLEQVQSVGGVEALAAAISANGTGNSAECNRLLSSLRDHQSQLIAQELQVERDHCEQFRLRCYLCSMSRANRNSNQPQTLELPNPKNLLSHVSKQTKHVLNRLGIFNVSSLHAYTCARSPQLLNSLLHNLSQQMQNTGNQRTLNRAESKQNVYRNAADDQLNSRSTQMFRVAQEQTLGAKTAVSNQAAEAVRRGSQVRLKVILPPPQQSVHNLLVDGEQTVEQLIEQLLSEQKAQLASQWRRLMRTNSLPNSEYFVCCKLVSKPGYFVPNAKHRLDSLPPIQHMRLIKKRIMPVNLQRASLDMMFGFKVEAECVLDRREALPMSRGEETALDTSEALRINGRLQVYVSKVDTNSLAARKGIRQGDELLQLNGAPVAELDMMYVECVLQEELSLQLVFRCVRLESADDQIDPAVRNAIEFVNEDLTGNNYGSLYVGQDETTLLTSSVRPNGRCFSGGNEQQMRQPTSRRHSEHLLISQEEVNDDSNIGVEIGRTIGQCIERVFETLEPSAATLLDQSFSDDYIDSLVCPPPPVDSALSDELIHKLIIPKPDPQMGSERSQQISNATTGKSLLDGKQRRLDSVTDLADNLIKSVQQVKAELGSVKPKIPVKSTRSSKPAQPVQTVVEVQLHNEPEPKMDGGRIRRQTDMPRRRKSEELPRRDYAYSTAKEDNTTKLSGALSGSDRGGNEIQTDALRDKKHSLTDSEKMHKVICELLDTENTYVSHLQRLQQMYLKPIRQQEILSTLDALSLFGRMDEVLQFQRNFLESLQIAVDQYLPSLDGGRIVSQKDYQKALLALSKLFLYHTPQFRLYSVFCSAHSKAQKLLFAKESPNTELLDFVKRISNGENAKSWETFLLQPIQRILKYPLLLCQLRELSGLATPEHAHLSAALKAMEKVAEHINEMHRINEYGHVLDGLQRTHYKLTRQLISVGPTQLLYYDQVHWRNAQDYLGKTKKSVELYSMCFVFSSAVVFFCMERNKQKKKSNLRDQAMDQVRYQILMPIHEVQVRATSCKKETSAQPTASNGSGGEEATPQFFWELIHIKSSLTSANTQKRSEKVFQLANGSSTFRNVFLRTIRRLIRESVANLPLPSKSTIGEEGTCEDGTRSGRSLPEESETRRPSETFCDIVNMPLDRLLEKQLQLRYFNATTLIRHLEETNNFEEEDKSCASEK